MPLVVPENTRQTFTICGVDPGTNFLGVGFITVHYRTLEISEIKAYTLEPTIDKEDDILRANHEERIERILSQQTQFTALIERLKPDIVASETPFYHHVHPGAYGPLVETVLLVRLAVLRYNPSIRFFTYAPLVVKSALDARPKRGFDTKDIMKQRLYGILEIKDYTEHPISCYDQNALDAIAVAYTHLLTLRHAYERRSP